MGTRADAARVKVWGYSKALGLRIGASVRGNRDLVRFMKSRGTFHPRGHRAEQRKGLL